MPLLTNIFQRLNPSIAICQTLVLGLGISFGRLFAFSGCTYYKASTLSSWKHSLRTCLQSVAIENIRGDEPNCLGLLTLAYLSTICTSRGYNISVSLYARANSSLIHARRLIKDSYLWSESSCTATLSTAVLQADWEEFYRRTINLGLTDRDASDPPHSEHLTLVRWLLIAPLDLPTA